MHGDDDERIGRRSDDGARLLVAETALTGVRQELKDVRAQYSTLADGQAVLSAVLIGRPMPDGTVTVGMAPKVESIREKQDDQGRKLDAINADMGDLKTAQADQAKTLAEHGTALERIEKWFAIGVGAFKRFLDVVGKGVLTGVGIGALHLLYLWWPEIANFFSTWGPAASTAAAAASKGHGH